MALWDQMVSAGEGWRALFWGEGECIEIPVAAWVIVGEGAVDVFGRLVETTQRLRGVIASVQGPGQGRMGVVREDNASFIGYAGPGQDVSYNLKKDAVVVCKHEGPVLWEASRNGSVAQG